MRSRYTLGIAAFLLFISLCIFFKSSYTPASSAKKLTRILTNSEWSVISFLDINLLRNQAESVNVNPRDGAVGINKSKYMSVGIQRRSSELTTYAILTKNVNLMETAIRIIEYAFAHQQLDGSFQDYTPKISQGGRASNVAFFYHDLGHSLLLLQSSQWFQKSEETANLRVRLNNLKTSANTSLTWLMAQEEALMNNDKDTTNRLFFDADAYYLVGKALGRPDAVAMGKRFAQAALQQQTETGIFLEKGGYDSSYQGVSLRTALLLYVNLQTDDVFLKRNLWNAITRGMNLELAHMSPTGQVSTERNTRVYFGGETYLGKEKRFDYLNLVFAINYYSYLSKKPFDKKIADRVFEFYHNHRNRN